MKAKTYNVCGLSRSGNHAIIFWIIHNLVNSVKSIGYDIYIDDNYKLCYINNCNICYDHQIKNIKNNFPCSFFETTIRSYEDIEFNNDTSLIVLRDFINLLCSRYQKYKESICLSNKYICDLLRLIEVWKQHTKSPRRTIIYNKWLISKDYRNSVSYKILDIKNTIDTINYVSKIGDGSSFDNSYERQIDIDYLTRYNQVKLPEYMIKYIISDKELLDINMELFDIDIKKILC